MVPQTGTGPASEEGFASGNADLLLKLQADLAGHGAEHVVVTSADHVFNMDLRRSSTTTSPAAARPRWSTAEVTKAEASDNVAVLTGRGGVVTDVEVKVSRPSTGTVATEIFVYRVEALLEALSTLRAELDARGRRRQRARRLRRAPPAPADRDRDRARRTDRRLLARPRPAAHLPPGPP